MIFIIEGPDGAGKTTLVNQLKQALPQAKVEHFGAPETDDDAFNYWQKYAWAIKDVQPGETVIFDRSWYSDLVYGPIMRDRQEMSQAHADMLSAMVVASGGGIIIYCNAPVKVLWSRCKARGETYITSQELLGRIAVLYGTVMSKYVSYLPVIPYNTAAGV